MIFDDAIYNAARALAAAEENAGDVGRARELISAANTWVRIAELMNHRSADSR